ncbi:DUF2817 domain-containing protein [Candidatus Bathyarchaeota archaeon]|nr:DUF2817 domain-containing protein [Candidatus Bathyarchaeota archaeon]
MPFLRDLKVILSQIGLGNLLKVLGLVVLVAFLLFYPLSIPEGSSTALSGVSYEYVEQVLSSYSDGLHGYSYGICGYSVKSKPIYYYVIGEGNETIIILGGLHGNEPKGTYACLELLANLTESGHLLKRYRFVVIPLCNPDGAAEFTRRNSRDVDLNRDFYAFSQPETQAVREVFLKSSPVLLIDVHESWGNEPVTIYANNTKSELLAKFFSLETGIPGFLAADVGQSANFAEKNGIYGVIIELPISSWKYGNGTMIVWRFIESWTHFERSGTYMKGTDPNIGLMWV